MNCMIGIDTNILVYAFDIAYLEKRSICKEIIEEIFSGKQKGVVTNQILAEFVNVVTRKIEKPLSEDSAKAIIGSIISSENWKIYNYTSTTILNSLPCNGSFWDFLIVQTLKENGINIIVTENVKDFSGFGIKVINPFKDML